MSDIKIIYSKKYKLKKKYLTNLVFKDISDPSDT